jgi:hypothetical protein
LEIVVRTIEPIVVKAVTTPSEAKVLAVDAGHATCAKLACAKSTCVNSAKASDVAAAKAADVATAHTAHGADVATAKTAATKAAAMATTATAAASGLCARGKQTSGEQCACKNHHRSSFHDILHSDKRRSATSLCQTSACLRGVNADVAIDWRCECSAAFSIKFVVI